MFGYQFELSGVKVRMRSVFDAQWRLLAGFAFMFLAMAAIQYEEQIAPEVTRITSGLDAVTADFRTKLTSFTL
ncbi:MAG: hypothetical protein R3C16_10400 [Hyphomonadaceae bacterium]